MRLASIFNDHQVVLGRQIHNRIHVGGLSVKMHRHDGRYTEAALTLGKFFGLAVKITVGFQIFAKFLRIHRVRGLVNVYESDLRASLRNGFRGSDKRVRHGDDDVALTDSRGHEREAQCIGPTVHTDAILAVAKSGKLALEIFHHRSADKACVAEGLLRHR